MKVAIVGYGKMGKVIEGILEERGHQVSARIDRSNKDEISSLKGKCDVAIEFTQPSAAMQNFETLIEQGIPVVTGTTGWYDHFDALSEMIKANNGSFFYATNFSVGVNIFFAINKKLAQMMSAHSDYTVSMDETHHTQKLDAPSGTAITLAEGILEAYNELESWELDSESNTKLTIRAHRIEGVPGTHEIHYRSEIDDIDIKHTAHSRKGFAMGAVLAAEFLVGKTGIHSMQDLLKV